MRDGQSVLDAALEAGMNLPHSCKSGHCTSCRAQLLGGRIHYPNGWPAGLTQAEHAAGRVLLCQARAASDLVIETRRIARATEVEIRRLPCRIERRVLLAADVLQLFLRLPAAEPFTFQPGQYLDVLLDAGRRRSFSIASPPHDAAQLELHVRRAPGSGFTQQLFDSPDALTSLQIEGPIGQFVYQPSAAPLLLIAGGTGFAPIKSILRHVLEVERGARPVRVYWGAQNAAGLYEDAQLLAWCASHPRLSYTGVLSDPPPELTAGSSTTVLAAHHRRGWVHQIAAAAVRDLAAHDIYLAGPPALIEAVRCDYVQSGVDPTRIRFDSFDYAPR